MRALVLVLLATYGGCCHVDGRDPPVSRHDCPSYSDAEIRTEVDRFAAAWHDEFGERVENIVRLVKVQCRPVVVVQGQKVAGVTLDHGTVMVSSRDQKGMPWTVREGALWHELTHIVLRSTTGSWARYHGDPWTYRHSAMIEKRRYP